MIKLDMKNYNMILTGKQQKYHHYHYGKLINMNMLQVKKIWPPDQSKIIQQAKFTYSPLRKTLEKQTKAIENQEEKQLKATGEDGKQVVNRNAIIKNFYYDTKKDVLDLKQWACYQHITRYYKWLDLSKKN